MNTGNQGDQAAAIGNVDLRRLLLLSWVHRLGSEAGFALEEHGSSGKIYQLGSQSAFHISAEPAEQPPYLAFKASDPEKQPTVDEITASAAARVDANDFGDPHWHSAHLEVPAYSIRDTINLMSGLLVAFSSPRISGWRRLGGHALLEFVEQPAPDWKADSLLPPTTIIHAHLRVPAPRPGYFCQTIASRALETVAAICSFAMMRTVHLPPMIMETESSKTSQLDERAADPNVLTLARQSIGLDVMGLVLRPGGLECFERLRSALLTFDAALGQRHDSVACTLFVIAAEALTVPNQPWRFRRQADRFCHFYRELMPEKLDAMIQHQNLESMFDIKRGRLTPRELHRKFLMAIYGFRSVNVHSGLQPTYEGMSVVGSVHVRRAFLAEFAETAILEFILHPLSCLTGHPMYSSKKPADKAAADE
jgi:hypothetical protein